jgi:hypothetical protein
MPNPKHQTPNKLKIQSTNDQNADTGRDVLNFGFGAFEFVWNLGFGAWDFRPRRRGFRPGGKVAAKLGRKEVR